MIDHKDKAIKSIAILNGSTPEEVKPDLKWTSGNRVEYGNKMYEFTDDGDLIGYKNRGSDGNFNKINGGIVE